MMPRDISSAQLSEELDVSEATVRGWVKNGCPHSKQGKMLRFDSGEVVLWRRSRGMDSHNRNAGASPNLDDARLRKENALADKHELHVAREKGKLMEVEEAKRIYGNLVRVTRHRVERIGALVAARWPGPDAGKLQAMIDAEAAAALTDVSQTNESS